MKTKKVGRPSRGKTAERKTLLIKLTPDERKLVDEIAKKYDGNVNKLFRVKVLGEKE